MTIKQFTVENYSIKLGDEMSATWGGVPIKARGIVACHGGDHRFIAYFLSESSPVPDSVYVEANKVGAVFRPFEEMGAYVDLLRNEKPVYAYLNSSRPEWNNLGTSLEPVGEEEA